MGSVGRRVIERVVRASPFRLSVLLGLLFTAAHTALGLLTYGATAVFTWDLVKEAVEADRMALIHAHQTGGVNGLAQAIRTLDREDPSSPRVLLLTDANHKPLAGTLARWPRDLRQVGGWHLFSLASAGHHAARDGRVLARTAPLPQGALLLVGRDLRPRSTFLAVLSRTLVLGGLITLSLALIGGILISRRQLRRVDALETVCRAVMGGAWDRRLPCSTRDDEIDRLATAVNAMLDENQRLLSAMQRVTQNVAHDLRTPLGRLRGRLENTLHGGPPLPESSRQCLEKAVTETDDLLATFNAMLHIAETESRAQRDFSVLDPAALVQEVAELYQPLLEEQGLTLTVTPAPVPAVQGDASLLAQAVSNLLDNAGKYTPAGGTLTLGTDSTPAGVVVWVADNGPGIPAGDRARMLEPFARLDRSRSTPGSGLGLNLVAAVARLHGADLTLSDTHPGARPPGLTVRLTLMPDDKGEENASD